MGQKVKENFRARKDYGTIDEVVETPNLIEVQKRSFNEFLQADIEPEDREMRGL